MAQETTTRLMTAEEFAALPDGPTPQELVRGEVIRMTPNGARHSDVSLAIGALLRSAVREREAGRAFGADCGFVLARDPDVVRAPDAAVVLAPRLPAAGVPVGFFPGAPDLAVEVVSPTDRPSDLEGKVADYLTAGTALVWVVYPDLRHVRVYRAPSETFVVGEGGTLAGDPVLPGLAIPVAEIFAQ